MRTPSSSPRRPTRSLAVLLSTLALMLLTFTGLGVGAAVENPSAPEAPGQRQSTAPPGDPSTKSPRARYLAVAERVPSFGGVFVTGMERSEDGRLLDPGEVQVWLTDRGSSASHSRARESIAARFPHALRDRPIEFVQAQHRFVDLVAWEKDLIDLLNEEGVNSLGISQRDNRLKVGVDDKEALRPTIEAEAAERGIPVDAILVVERGPVKPNLQDSHRPLVGGLQVSFATAAFGGELGRCTMGFIAEIDGVSGFITAGHCSETMGQVDDSNYYQPNRGVFSWTNFIGTERIDPAFGPHGLCPAGRQCKLSDANFSEKNPAVDSALGFVAKPPMHDNDWDGDDTFMITGNRTAFVGDWVELVGKTSGWEFGKVLDRCVHVNVDPSERAAPASNLTLLCMVVADYPAQDGDSGGAVLSWIDWGGQGEAAYSGVHYGIFEDSGEAVFSSQYYVRDDLWSGSDFHICHPHSQTWTGC